MILTTVHTNNTAVITPSTVNHFANGELLANCQFLCKKCTTTTTCLVKQNRQEGDIQVDELIVQKTSTYVACGCCEVSKPTIAIPTNITPEISCSLPKQHWSGETEKFKLRSATYLQDKKKAVSDDALFDLIAMDLLEVDQHVCDVAKNLKGGVAQRFLEQREALSSTEPKPFLFVVHFQLPGDKNLAFIAYFASKPGALDSNSPAAQLFHSFINGTDAFRQSRFKFIPLVSKGPYLVKSMVGSTPAILGNKLTQSYHSGIGYFEVCVDVGSSSVGGGLLKLVKGYLTSLTFDMCFVLEAQTVDELPEVSLGQLRFANVDLRMAQKFMPS